MPVALPRILIIDDQFGRTVAGGFNRDRRDLCLKLGLTDVSNDTAGKAEPRGLKSPIAEAVFFRGQRPFNAGLGDTVENDLDGCVRAVRDGWENSATSLAPWALVVVDLCFYTGEVTAASERDGPGMPVGREGDDDPRRYFGLEILAALRREFPALPVAVLSSMARDPVSREFAQRGAVAFIARDDPNVQEVLAQTIQRHGLLPDPSGRIIGHSKGVLIALREARRLAGQDHGILLQGDSGTGKELFARYIHAMTNSSRSGVAGSARPRPGPLLAINSAGLSETLFQSELFGHMRGAFTDAKTDHVGMLEQAEGGDLFLDEIQNMPGVVQAGLLRAIDQRAIRRLGGREDIPVDVRFLSATNSRIEAEIAAGRFRNDLFYRLRAGGTITLLPLRERADDIPLLAESILERVLNDNPSAREREITPEAKAALRAYSWPGNVRELEEVIRNAVSRFQDLEHLVPEHFHFSSIENFAPGSAVSLRRPSDQSKREESNLTDAGEGPAVTASLKDSVVAEQQRLGIYLGKCLEATKNPVTGDIEPTKAFKMAVPSSEWGKNPTTAAADWIKRLLGLHSPTAEKLIAERAHLAKAVTWANGVRRSKVSPKAAP